MIDLVHDIANSYRLLIHANSYPGNVYSIQEFISNNSIDVPFFEPTLLFVYMLLDAEVTFAVVGDKDKEATHLISRLTFAKEIDIESADFIFILSTASETETEQAVKYAKIGTLIDPHNAATIICEVDSVTSGNEEILYGPGISGEKRVSLNMFKEWKKLRYKKNIEYPLGIEMYLIDKFGDILALPRTTQVKGCE